MYWWRSRDKKFKKLLGTFGEKRLMKKICWLFCCEITPFREVLVKIWFLENYFLNVIMVFLGFWQHAEKCQQAAQVPLGHLRLVCTWGLLSYLPNELSESQEESRVLSGGISKRTSALEKLWSTFKKCKKLVFKRKFWEALCLSFFFSFSFFPELQQGKVKLSDARCSQIWGFLPLSSYVICVN